MRTILFDDRLLWFGVVAAAGMFVVSLPDSTVPIGWPQVIFHALLGVGFGVTAQLALTVVLLPIAYYQKWRMQYAMPRWKAAAAVVAGTALWWVVFHVFGRFGDTLVGRVVAPVMLVLGVVGAYTEWVARKKIPVMDVSRSRDLQVK